jgi:hypothetical protein
MFGISFGAKKSKTNELATINKDVTTNQSQTSNQAQSTTGTQATSQTGSTTSTGASTNTAATQTAEQQQQTQQGTTKNFSDQTFAGLDAAVNSMLGGSAASDAAKAASTGALTQLGSFNIDDYVNGIVGSAKADSQTVIDETKHGYESNIGGTAATNSAAALLTSRLQNDQAAKLAGITSNAQATGAGILQANVDAAAKQQGADNTILGQLSEILKGGTTSTTGTSTGTTTGSQNTAGANTTSEAGTSASNTNTQTTQDVLTQIQQLLQGTENTNGTTNTTTKKTDFGGGFSLGI